MLGKIEGRWSTTREGQEYWSGKPFPSPRDLSNPRINPRSPALQADSLPAEPRGKPKNTGVGSFSLLQGIFLTQESNQGLLHCRWILYQLTYHRWTQGLSLSKSETLTSGFSFHIINKQVSFSWSV